MEQLIFVLLVAVIGLVNWIAKRAQEAKEQKENQMQPPQSATPVRGSGRRPAESEEERVRRFLEALGVPTSSAPPPKVQPRAPVVPPPLTTTTTTTVQVEPRSRRYVPKELRPFIETLEPRIPPVPTKPPPLVVPEPAPVTFPTVTATEEHPRPSVPVGSAIFEVRDVTIEDAPLLPIHETRAATERRVRAERTVSAVQSSITDFTVLLRSPQGLRNAVLLQEVLGRPRGLRALEEARSF